MLRRALFVAGWLFAFPAAAQSVASGGFVSYSTQVACLTRSAQQCQAMGCDGKKTVYWWNCAQLSDGTWGLQIDPFGPFAATTRSPVNARAVGLSAAEKATISSALTPIAEPAGQ